MHRRIPILSAGAALMLGSCGLSSLGAPDPASEEGEAVFELYRWFAAAAVGVAVFVTTLLVYVVIRYRRRDDDIPDQKPYNIPMEVLYTATPLVIVGVLFAFSVGTQVELDDTTDDPYLRVDVVGFQWQWQFRYPETGLVVTGTPEGELPELVLPAHRTTQLDLLTPDVIHSFWVPRFLNKRDMIPGVDNRIDVTPTELGVFEGVCAEFCGLDHGRMRFVVRVLEPDEFDRWLEEAS